MLTLVSTLLFLSLSTLSYGLTDETKNSFESMDEDKKYGTIIGIDLGTTFTCVGIYKNGRVEIIVNDRGNIITPSYVAVTDSEETLMEDDAKSQLTLNPENTIFDALVDNELPNNFAFVGYLEEDDEGSKILIFNLL